MRSSRQLIDIAANLLDPMFQGIYRGNLKHKPDLDIVLARAAAFDVQHIIITAGSLSEARDAAQMVKAYPKFRLSHTVGVHPTRAKELEDGGSKYFQELLEEALLGSKEGRVVAVGECGLDYDRLEFCSKEIQLKQFQQHFEIAEATGLPMFLHNRNTGGDFVDLIRKNRHRFKSGVVHSFTGNSDELDQLLAMDLYIGVNGCSLKTAENLDVVRRIPLNRLQLETDCPWCDLRRTHASHEYVKTQWPAVDAAKNPLSLDKTVKSRNEPCHLVQVLEAVAGCRGEPIELVANTVYANTCALFPFSAALCQPEKAHESVMQSSAQEEAAACAADS
jgi:TatD DNase family protein